MARSQIRPSPLVGHTPPPLLSDRPSLQKPGKLIYNLYGQKTEEAFVNNWGVGLAIEQAQSFQDLVNDAGKAFLILLVLDMVLTGPARWFEEHVDFLSVQGTLLAGRIGPDGRAIGGATWGDRMRAHLTFYGNSRGE